MVRFCGTEAIDVLASFTDTGTLIFHARSCRSLAAVTLAPHLHAHGQDATGALIGFATLLVGSFSRFGVWRQIVAALVLLVLVKLVEGVSADAVQATPAMWPLAYAPSVAGIAMAAGLLAWAGRSRRPRKPHPLPEAPA